MSFPQKLRPPRHVVIAWLVLLILLAGNIVLAYAGIGVLTLPATLIVAVAMAALVVTLFMELGRKPSLSWVFAIAGFVWLAILISMVATDYLSRYSYAPT